MDSIVVKMHIRTLANMHLCHQSMRAPKAKVPKPKELAQFICLLLVYIVITCLSDANGYSIMN